MRDKLINYVDLLFTGIPDSEDIKQEILQNTLDRYDDLLAQGKMPEAAYQLAISGIGDISDITGTQKTVIRTPSVNTNPSTENAENKPAFKKILLAVGICLYIFCPIPLFLLENKLGLCVLFAIAGIATALVIISSSNGLPRNATANNSEKEDGPIDKLLGSVSLAVYLILSFATSAWHITWLVFPIMAAVKGIINACKDLKEGT